MRIFACCFLALVCLSAFAQEAQQIPVGAVPRGVAFYPSGNQLIVSSFANNSVNVLDLETLKLRTVEESVSTAAGVAVDDRLGLAVVANSESNEVTLINLVTLQVVARVPVGSRPLSVDINSSTHIAVVSNANSDSLSLIDLTTRTVVGTVPDVPVLAGAVLSGAVQAVAVNSATNVAVVASPAQNSITLVDLAEPRVVDTLTVGASPVAVAVNPVTNVAVVCNASGNSVSIVKLGTGEITEEVPIGSPQGVAIHIRTNTAVISSNTTNQAVLLDLTTNEVIGQFSSLTGPTAAATNQRGRQTAVVLSSNNSVALIDIPVVSDVTIVNAAGFHGGRLAPGAIVSGFGTGLADTEPEGVAASGFPLPTTLGDVRVRMETGGLVIGGGGSTQLDAPLFFVSPTQINFQIPIELLEDVQRSELLRTPFGVAPLIIGSAGTVEGQGEVFSLGPATPALFTIDGSGSGSVAARNDNGSLVSVDGCLQEPKPAKPAAPGSVVQLFGTGQGALTTELATGEPVPRALCRRTALRRKPPRFPWSCWAVFPSLSNSAEPRPALLEPGKSTFASRMRMRNFPRGRRCPS